MKSLKLLKSTLQTTSAESLFDSVVAIILVLEPVYNALIAVLTSAAVVLCSSNMNSYTKRSLLFFVGCIVLLIILLSQSQVYNKRHLVEKSQNGDGKVTATLMIVMKLLHRGKEKCWKWIIAICFCALLVCLHFFSVNSLKSIAYERESDKLFYQEQFSNLNSIMDSLGRAQKNDSVVLKELKLSLEELEQFQQEQNETFSRLIKQIKQHP